MIVELCPLFAESANKEFSVVSGVWSSHKDMVALAPRGGHSYVNPISGTVKEGELPGLLDTADALVFVPSVSTPNGMVQPLDGEHRGREMSRRLLTVVSQRRPDLHVVLISHFLVGHGVAHKNAMQGTLGLRAVEAYLRAGRNPWTILRPTWGSAIHDSSYQTRLTQDPHADGLVSNRSVAEVVMTAIEHPEVSVGVTAALFNLSIPNSGVTDLVAQFGSLDRDYEAEVVYA